MRFRIMRGLAATVVLAGALTLSPTWAKPVRRVTAFVGVTVLPMTDGPAELADQTVIVDGDKIAELGPRATTPIPAGAVIIRGDGRVLMPGLADMHGHVTTRDELALYLANGVTMVRSMWGEPPVLRMREEVGRGVLAGPDLVVAGRIVDGADPIHFGTVAATSPEIARRTVAEQRAAGYDFVKVYAHLDLATFDALAAEAKAADIPFGGHVPDAVPTDHAMRAGMASIEHLTGFAKSIAATPVILDTGTAFDPEALKTVAAVGRGDVVAASLQDPAKLAALAAEARAAGTAIVPTMALIDSYTASADQVRAAAARDEMRYMSPGVRGLWRALDPLFLSRSPEIGAGFGRLRANYLAQIKAVHDAGGLLLVGTDAPNPYVFTGFDVAREVVNLAEAGLSPREALLASTRNAARFLGRDGQVGVITPGARANLLLLDANPLTDLGALRRIQGVVKAGRWYDRRQLDAMLEDIASRNADWARRVDAMPPLPTDLAGATVATFRVVRQGRDVGTARLAMADQGRRLQWQERVGQALRVEDVVLGDDGRVVRWTREGRSKTELAGAVGRRVMTGTPADAYTLAALIGAGEGGAVLRLSPNGRAAPVTLRVDRGPVEIIAGHYGWLGATSVRLSVAGADSRVWIGARFFAGAPMRFEAENGTLRYERVE